MNLHKNLEKMLLQDKTIAEQVRTVRAAGSVQDVDQQNERELHSWLGRTRAPSSTQAPCEVPLTYSSTQYHVHGRLEKLLLPWLPSEVHTSFV